MRTTNNRGKKTTSQPVQPIDDKVKTQDPAERLARAVKKLAEIEDGTDAAKTKKKRLGMKISKLRKQLGLKEAVKVERENGWTEDKKKEMRMAGNWTRVAPNLNIAVDDDAVRESLDKRTAAKMKKDYKVADEHATELQEIGVCYDDTSFTWYIKIRQAEKRSREGEEGEGKKKKQKK